MPEDDGQQPRSTLPPPYVSFRTLQALIERMEKPGPPPRIDRSYLIGMSGGAQAQMLAALRALGLIDSANQVTSPLVALVRNPDQRPQLMAQLFRERYPSLVALGEANATQGQLEEELRHLGRTGDSLRKAVAFYLAAARYADLPLSPHFNAPRRTLGGSDGAPRRRTTRGRRTARPVSGEPSDNAPPPTADPDAMRRIYFDLLVDKAKQADTPDPELLNRIERVIGIDSQEGHKKAKVEAEAEQD